MAESDVPEDGRLRAMLERLHAQSEAQEHELHAYAIERERRGQPLDVKQFDDEARAFFADKMVTLDRDKAAFCYRLCRAMQARRIVEAGTSFGVSTLYLAASLRDSGATDGVVIATEFEPDKAAIARRNFEAAELESYIELREGDLRETLKRLEGPIDFVLIDIWEVALPALKLVAPHLRPGGVVVADNTLSRTGYYADYFAFLSDPANRFTTMTLPFNNGFEFSVRI